MTFCVLLAATHREPGHILIGQEALFCIVEHGQKRAFHRDRKVTWRAKTMLIRPMVAEQLVVG